MKIVILAAMLVLLTVPALAGVPYLNPTVFANGALGASPDPKQTVIIADNYSHTITLTNQIWYNLIYQGSSGCIVRLMNTSTKASWPAETVTGSGGVHSYLLHYNVKFLNYSGCAGTGSANSIIHFQ